MANEEIIASDDTFLDEQANTQVRSAIDNMKLRTSGANEDNPVMRFDVSGMEGKSWDSAILRLTYHTASSSLAGTTNIYLSYIEETDLDVNDCSWDNKVQVGGPTAWDGAAGAEDSTSNDHTTRVDWTTLVASTGKAVGDVVQSPDLTTIINKAISDNAGILNLIMYSPGTNTAIQWFRTLETAAVPVTDKPTLVFANVQFDAAADPGVTSTDLTAAESASLSSKSNRPPVSEPSRQARASILHDGVEPMTILALVIKATFGTDA